MFPRVEAAGGLGRTRCSGLKSAPVHAVIRGHCSVMSGPFRTAARPNGWSGGLLPGSARLDRPEPCLSAPAPRAGRVCRPGFCGSSLGDPSDRSDRTPQEESRSRAQGRFAFRRELGGQATAGGRRLPWSLDETAAQGRSALSAATEATEVPIRSGIRERRKRPKTSRGITLAACEVRDGMPKSRQPGAERPDRFGRSLSRSMKPQVRGIRPRE